MRPELDLRTTVDLGPCESCGAEASVDGWIVVAVVDDPLDASWCCSWSCLGAYASAVANEIRGPLIEGP